MCERRGKSKRGWDRSGCKNNTRGVDHDKRGSCRHARGKANRQPRRKGVVKIAGHFRKREKQEREREKEELNLTKLILIVLSNQLI
jgi:hypothetical protein